MKSFFAKLLIGLASLIGVHLTAVAPQPGVYHLAPKTYGSITTTAGNNFPTSSYSFNDGDIVNAGDFNNLFTYVGTRSSTDTTSLSYNVNNPNLASSTGVLSISRGGVGTTTAPLDGQIPIGSGGNYKISTLSAGTNITITNSSGSVSIAASGLPQTSTSTFNPSVRSSGSGSSTVIGLTSASGTWTVPNGIYSIVITARGGDGGSDSAGIHGGGAATATGTLAVSPGNVYYFNVGGKGSAGNAGYGGGGTSAGAADGAGGGGATWFGTNPSSCSLSVSSTLIVVAAGGGGAGGGGSGGRGGNGGGPNGSAGQDGLAGTGAGGATQISGGSAGSGDTNGTSGSFCAAGNGGANGGHSGGGGGGGYFGGGGGAGETSNQAGGGGGGSSFVSSTLTATSMATGTTATSTLDGQITITYDVPSKVVGNDYGGTVSLQGIGANTVSSSTVTFGANNSFPSFAPGCAVMTSQSSVYAWGQSTTSSLTVQFSPAIQGTSTYMYTCM